MWTKKGSQASVLQSATLLLSALALFQVQATTTSENRLTAVTHAGVSSKDDTRSRWLHDVSLMGGAGMKVRGKFCDSEGPLFNTVPELNGFAFTIDDNNWSGNTRAFVGPSIDGGDVKSSRPSQGRLSYTTPSFYDFFEWTPDYQWMFTDFHYLFESGHYQLNTQMSVYNLETMDEIVCAGHDRCDVRYQIRYTPMLWDTIPSNVIRDMDIEFMINPMGARYAINSNEDFLMEANIINGKFAEYEDVKYSRTYRTSSYLPGSYGAIVGDSKASEFEEPQLMFKVGYQYSKTTALHGNYAETDWWFVRVHPYMTKLRKNIGKTGEKAVVILKGMDFKFTTEFNSDIHITVDGVECEVKKLWNSKIKCKTVSKAPQDSLIGVTQPGQPGLRMKLYDHESNYNVDFDKMRDGTEVQKGTDIQHTSFEYRQFGNDRYGTVLSGFFKAPATGRFRFRMSCDDQCQLDFSTTAFDAANPVEPVWIETPVAYRNSWTHWRHQFLDNDPSDTENQPNSEWFDLEEGAFYPIRGIHREYTGSDHFSVGVEQEVADSIGSWHDRKQVQRFEISQGGAFETWYITVDSPDGGNFKVALRSSLTVAQYPDEPVWTSGDISDKASDYELRSKIDDYFWRYSSSITVTSTWYDSTGGQTQVLDDATQIVYKIVLNRKINDFSFDEAFILLGESAPTGAAVVIQKPQDIGPVGQESSLSGPPLSGKFRIECVDPVTWQNYTTMDINYNSGINGIHLQIMETMPHLTFHSSIFNSDKYPYRENGVEFFLQVDYTEGALVTGGMDLCTIYDAPDAIDGTFMGIAGSYPQFEVAMQVPFGINKFWPAIPMEMLRTDDQEPPVLATIGGLEVLCPDLNCHFAHVGGSNEIITAFDIDSNNVLTVDGIGLPTDPADLEIEIAHADCIDFTITSEADGSQITCQLDHAPEAGFWYPEVDGPTGMIAIQDGVPELEIALIVTSIVPSDDLNSEGGDLLTIIGSGFPASHAERFTIQLSGRKNLCELTPMTTTNVCTCVTSPFNQDGFTYQASTDIPVIFELNSQTNTDQSLTLGTTNYDVIGVSKASLSPVLRQSIDIYLDSSVPASYYADKDKWSTFLSCIDTGCTYTELEMFVEVADASTSSLTIKFPGAPSGNYNIRVHHEDVGNFIATPPTALNVRTEAIVTAVYPESGSVLGGTELTIDGINFSDDPLDNHVTVDGRACLVLTTSETQITCRITREPPIATTRRLQSFTDIVDESILVSDGKIIVYLSTSEEAQWDSAQSNDWTWDTPTGEITNIVTGADPNVQNIMQSATVTGTGFPSDSTQVSLYINGRKQTTWSSTPTEIKFTLSDISSGELENFLIYLPDGLPTGTDNWISQTLTPTFYGFFKTTGSAGGGKMRFGGTGVGSETDPSTIDLLFSDDGFATAGVPLCEESLVAEDTEGTFSCLIGQREITSAAQIRLQVGSTIAACDNTQAPFMCSYEALVVNSPQVTSFSIDDFETITITGQGFQPLDDDGYEPGVLIDDVSSEATSTLTQFQTQINSDTFITVKFQWGVPRFLTPKGIYLGFQDAFGNIEVAYQAPPTPFTIAFNPLTIDLAQSGLVCSFMGGCSYYVFADGLAAELRPGVFRTNNNRIDICGRPCEVDWDQSDSQMVYCTLPLLPTRNSVSKFSLTDLTDVLQDATITASTPSEVDKLTDGSLLVEYSDSGSTCFIDFEFTEDYLGVLDSISFYIDMIDDISPFVGSLVFQGSNDLGATWDDLWYPDASVQEGWNMKWWADDNCVEGADIPDKPSYNKYRFYGTEQGACRFTEIKSEGVTTHEDLSFTSECVPYIITEDLDETDSLGFGSDFVTEDSWGGFIVQYKNVATPRVNEISPRIGTVKGNELLTFTGEKFTSPSCSPVPCNADPVIMIDGLECVLQSGWTDTQLTCLTAEKIQPYQETGITIFIDGYGYAALKGNTFTYGHMWSDTDTWGNDMIPQLGEAVHVPRDAVIIMDVDTTPALSLITVEGSLIIPPDADPNHQRELNAEYIIVKEGYMEVGTKDHPYTSKLTITLSGTEDGPFIPIYGNAVLGVRDGTLEMHGVTRSHTWTMLNVTASAGDSSITLIEMEDDKVLDWQIGENIVIATSDIDSENSEVRTITGVSDADTFPVITLDAPLTYTHFAAIELVGEEGSNDWIDMRAEVGLLSRNILFQGGVQDMTEDFLDEAMFDEFGVENGLGEYGAHIYIHTIDTAPSIARIENIEMYSVGQGYRIDRYPINFDTVGSSHLSSVQGNSIWNSYNKAIVLSNTQYLKIRKNVMYNVLGHNIYTQDASEIHNCIAENLIMDTRKSWSMLNTDQYPGSIWLQHPNNIVRGNHVAGSDAYGIVYDLPNTSSGILDDPNICPNYANLGEFRENVAHSNGRYGLFLKSDFSPRRYPCFDMDDHYDGTDPDNYGITYKRRLLQTVDVNPPVVAYMEDLTAYKNGRDGSMAVSVGAVQFWNFKTADNLEAGVEVHDCGTIPLGYSLIKNGLFIGKSSNTETLLDEAAPVGIWMPSSDNFLVDGARFFNYDQTGVEGKNAAAFATASNSENWFSTGAGAFQYETENLYFDGSVSQLIRYEYPYKEFFLDRDGTLTGVLGADSYAAADWKHLHQDFCYYDQTTLDLYGGLICDDGAQLRRITFHGAEPSGNFRGQTMKITLFDAFWERVNSISGTLQAYLDDDDNYSIVGHKTCSTRSCVRELSWAIPFATNQRYRIHWGWHQDFTKMKMEMSKYWFDTDNSILFNMNFTDVREEVRFTTEYGNGHRIENDTLSVSPQLQTLGDNIVKNDTDVREFEFVVNFKNETRGKKLLIEGFKCLDNVCGENIQSRPLEENQRLWSVGASWDSGEVPKEGEDVVIKPGINMLYDITNSPLLNSLEVNGRLSFKNEPGHDATLNAMKIHVRAGELLIGADGDEHQGKAKIILHGDAESESLLVTSNSQTLNKALVNTGTMKFYGQRKVQSVTRLVDSVLTGETDAVIESSQDIEAGDMLYFAPTAMSEDHGEYKTVVSYNDLTGQLVLAEAFEYYHFGDWDTKGDFEGVDMRGEVAILTRNVVIQGTGEDAWGCQVLTTDMLDYEDNNLVTRRGVTVFDSVEVQGCSQRDTSRAAVQFKGANSGLSSITHSAIWDGLGWGLYIDQSTGVSLDEVSVIGFVQLGINIDRSSTIDVSCAFVSDITERDMSNYMDGLHDSTVGIAVCAWSNPSAGSICTDVNVACSIVSGTVGAGFIAPGVTCTETGDRRFYQNVAHSIRGVGAIVFPDPNQVNSKVCYQVSEFAAYKNQEQGLATYFNSKKIEVFDSVFIDNALGISLQIGGEYLEAELILRNSFVFGESSALAQDVVGGVGFCEDKNAIMMFGHNRGSKAIIEGRSYNLPFYKTIHPGGWGAQAYITDVEFEDFTYQTQCGKTQVIFKNSETASDFIPIHHLDDSTFTNVDMDAVINIVPLPLTFIQISECGNFPCTGNKNIVIQYKDLEPNTTPIPTDSGTISSAISQRIYPGFNCNLNGVWNAWICSNEDIGQVLFESLDDDRWDRSVQPIYIFDQWGYVNILNSFRDHFNDGYYTSQERLSRFNAALQMNTPTGSAREYTFKFTGTPPETMKFQLQADTGGIVIKIPFYSAGSYQITVDNSVVPMTAWDPNLGSPAALTKMSGCGENRFVSMMNFLEFYITAGCVLEIGPRDAIQGMVRLEWSLAEFYAQGGVTRFVDRLAGSIGIHRSRIKVVHVYEGSVILDFFIDAEKSSSDDPEGAQKELEKLTESLVDIITNGKVDFGAEVIGLSSDSVLLYGDPIPPDAASLNVQSQAVRTDDTNLYDRFVRIQELLNERAEEQSLFDEPLITLDTSLDGTEEEESKQKTVYLTLDELQTGAALKYSILILGFLVLISLVITSICIFRCITRSRSQVMETIKAQELAAKGRELEETQVQFAHSQAQETINQTRTNTFGPMKAQKMKDIKGMQDDVVLPDGAENVAVVDLKTRKTKKKKRKVLTKKVADADADGLGDASKRTDFFNSSTNFNATSKSLKLGEISEVQSSGMSLNDKNDA